MEAVAQGDPGGLADEFVVLNELLYAGCPDEAFLQRLVQLAVAAVPGCASASVSTWSASRQFRVLASSDATSLTVNELQHQLGDGPCFTAASRSEVVRLPDLDADQRWPQFSTTVQELTDVRGMLSFHLVRHPTASALSLFSTERGAFGPEAFNVAALFAAHARVLLTHAASADRAANLQTALLTSRQIGAAIGILMSTLKITEDDAFAVLQDSSRNLNRKLRDVANDVTQTGALPAKAPKRSRSRA